MPPEGPKQARINEALSSLTGEKPDVNELRTAITGATVADIRELMTSILKNPTSARHLREQPAVRLALQQEAAAARDRELKASQAALERVRNNVELLKLAQKTHLTIKQHAAETQALIAGTSLTGTGASEKVAAMTTTLLGRLSGLPGIGWLIAPFAVTAATNPQGVGTRVLRGLEGAFYNITANMGGSIPFLGNSAKEWGTDNMNRLQAAQQIERSLPILRTLDRATVTNEKVKAFIAIPRTPPATWQTALTALVERYVRATPGIAGPVTWETIRDADTAEARGREEADKRLAASTLAQFGPDKVLGVTLAPEADTTGASAVRGAGGKFAVTISRALLNPGSGAPDKPESLKLKDLVRTAGESVHAIAITAAGTPPAFRKSGTNVALDFPMGTNQSFEQSVTKIAEALKRNDALDEMRYDMGIRGLPALPRIQMKLESSRRILGWNALAQATPIALQTLPEDLDTVAFNTQWRWLNGAWAVVA